MSDLTKQEIKALIEENDALVARAIHVLYLQQTSYERNAHTTVDANGVGFNAFDADFLTSLAERIVATLNAGGSYASALTPRQIAAGRRAVKKYAGQIARLTATVGA